ncbi:MAG: channel protein TolC [Rhizobiales bacterium 65-9]|nr:TolC family outer membrane protein [Hyphomicrobiales bacterium]OJY36702.1 MAG: channel protein TolC [Rhizobiales bacterium 65-9]
MAHDVRTSVAAAVLAAGAMVALQSPAAAETLEGALGRAYGNNPTLNAQRASLRATDESVSQALSGYRPRISGSADVGAQQDRTTLPGGTSTQNYLPRGVSLSISQTIWNGNRTQNSVSQAESQVFAARETLRNSENQVLLDGVTAYMNVMRDTAILGVRRSNVEVLEEQLRQVRDRFNVGEVTRTDVAQTEAQLASGRSDAAGAEANLRASLATYRQRIGVDAKRLAPARPLDRFVPKSLDAGVASALREHPAINAAMHGVDVAQLNVKVIEGELYPSLTATGSISRRWDLQGSDVERSSAAIVGTLSIPIYEGGQVYSRVRQAKEQLGQQRISVDIVRDQVRQAVMASWATVEATKLQVSAAQAQVQAAEVALAGVREEAKVGQRTTLDVLNAQQTVANGRVALVSAQRDRVVATYALLSALGRLSAQTLALKVERYNPRTHYDMVRDKFIGLDTPGGR